MRGTGHPHAVRPLLSEVGWCRCSHSDPWAAGSPEQRDQPLPHRLVLDRGCLGPRLGEGGKAPLVAAWARKWAWPCSLRSIGGQGPSQCWSHTQPRRENPPVSHPQLWGSMLWVSGARAQAPNSPPRPCALGLGLARRDGGKRKAARGSRPCSHRFASGVGGEGLGKTLGTRPAVALQFPPGSTKLRRGFTAGLDRGQLGPWV